MKMVDFAVESEPDQPPSQDEIARSGEKFSIPGCAGLSLVVYLGLGLLMIALLVALPGFGAWLGVTSEQDAMGKIAQTSLVLSIPLAILINLLWTARKSRQNADSLLKRRRIASRDTADRATIVAQQLLWSAIREIETLPRLLDDARNELTLAEREFQARAYSSFWDAVDRSGHALSQYRQGLTTLKTRQGEYEKTLAGRKHNFPPFPLEQIKLPSPDPLLVDLRVKARRGDTDIDFARIRELKKTRTALLEELRSNAETMDVLTAEGQRTRDDVSDFRRSFEEYSRAHLKHLGTKN